TATLYDNNDDVERVIINFKEAMAVDGNYSVLDIDKYTIGGKALADFSDYIEIAALDGNKKVEISLDLDKAVEDGKNIDFEPGQTVRIGRVADAAGNKTSGYYFDLTLVSAGYVVIDTIEAVSETE